VWSIDGNGWNGFFVSSFALTTEIAEGNISGNGADTEAGTPDDGFRMVGEQDIMNDVTVTGTTIEANAGDGVSIETQDHACTNTSAAADFVFFGEVTVSGNGASGFNLLSVPGLSRTAQDPDLADSLCQFLTDVPLNVTTDQYGIRIEDSTITANGGDGITLGVGASAEAQVLARIGGPGAANTITLNEGSGIAMDGGTEGDRVGATIVNNLIHDNTGPGFTLGSSIVVPLFETGGVVQITLGLGFVQNEVNHNAMLGAGCTVEQTAPQILINGPTAIPGDHCDGISVEQCDEQSDADGTNWHCVATSTDCFVAHDLRGDLEPNCPNGLRNAIYGYNVSDSGNNISVGARAVNNSAADMSNNEWQHSTSSQNVTQATGSFIQAEITCGTRGCGM
jgi:hypothetical protein